jgi:hypothetical protein
VTIDAWWAAQSPSAPVPALALALAPAQAHVIFTWESPPHTDTHSALTSRIKEIVESHILEVSQVINIAKEELEFLHNIYEVFTAEKKKHKSKASKAPELATPPQHVKPHNNNSGSSRSGPQFCYQPTAKDECLVSKLRDYLMQGQLSLTTPTHVFATSSSICKDVVDRLKAWHVETHEYKEVGLPESSTQQPKANATHTTEKVVYKPLQPTSSQHDLW